MSGEAAQLRGQLLQSRLEYVLQRHGPAAVERVLQALPEGHRARLHGLARDAWYPFRTLVLLDRAIVDTLGGSDEMFVDLGRASARHRSEWLGPHAPLISVHGFLARMADKHRRFHTFGRAEYRRLGFHNGEIAFSEYPEADAAFCLSGLGYLAAAVELLSGGPATVAELTCQARGQSACRFDVRWQEGAPAAER